MNYKISHPTKIIECEIDLPSSKSISNRLLIIQALCKKKFLIHNLSNSNDTTTLKNALNSTENIIDVEGAGTSFRFLTSYFSIKKEVNLILTGNSRMQERPIKALAKALIDIGAKIEYTDHLNFPPLKITGTKIKGGKVSIDGTKSSQFISSLLLIAPVLENGLEIEIIGDLVSKPYVQMTLSLMKQFGISYSWEKNVIIIRPQEYIATDFTVEADWSAAAFWFQIACLSKKCNIRLNGLSEKSIQGDKEIRDLFRNLGVESIFKKGPLFLTKKNNILTQNIIDLKNTPDLYQPLKCVSLALQKDIIFKGISTLKDKESDRIKATNNELLKLKSSKIINTHNDHRIAMSFTPLSLIFGEIQINNPEVVQKSYVNFWKDIIKAGFKISSSNLTSN